MKTSVRWFEKARTEEQRKEMRAILLSAYPAFMELKRIIEANKEASRKARVAKASYDNPSWAYLQADAVGEERAYDTVLKLISIKVEE